MQPTHEQIVRALGALGEGDTAIRMTTPDTPQEEATNAVTTLPKANSKWPQATSNEHSTEGGN